jgi:hypothetical protein
MLPALLALPSCTASTARSCCQLLQRWIWAVSMRAASLLPTDLLLLLLLLAGTLVFLFD